MMPDRRAVNSTGLMSRRVFARATPTGIGNSRQKVAQDMDIVGSVRRSRFVKDQNDKPRPDG